ncbi:MAG: hypothetical protein II590_02345 [Clostridia bacterium]|jgi:hypothetical protein|nr:hypothetical protein [Clostridia bacterium]MBQ4446897.1 hypothetical protein [Clostridia bacterium]
MDRRLLTAKRFGVAALAILIAACAVLAFVTAAAKTHLFVGRTLRRALQFCIFFWLFFAPAATVFSTAGLVMAKKAERRGLEKAGRVCTFCSVMIGLIGLGFLIYTVTMSSFY